MKSIGNDIRAICDAIFQQYRKKVGNTAPFKMPIFDVAMRIVAELAGEIRNNTWKL